MGWSQYKGVTKYTQLGTTVIEYLDFIVSIKAKNRAAEIPVVVNQIMGI